MNKKLLNRYSPIPTPLPGFEHQSLPETVCYLKRTLVFPYLEYDQLTYYKKEWFNHIMTITFNDNFSKEQKISKINEISKKIWLYEKVTGGRKNATGGRDPKKHRKELADNFNQVLRKCFDDCEECGAKLNYHFKFNRHYYEMLNYSRPSIDRINSKAGYTVNNVRIICVDCNTEKKDKENYNLNIIK